jgi:hypothetical protein
MFVLYFALATRELCQKNQIGDEYHYIFECTNLSAKRTSLLPKHLIERPNIIKFKYLNRDDVNT